MLAHLENGKLVLKLISVQIMKDWVRRLLTMICLRKPTLKMRINSFATQEKYAVKDYLLELVYVTRALWGYLSRINFVNNL